MRFTKYSHISLSGYNYLKTNHVDNFDHGDAPICPYVELSLKHHTYYSKLFSNFLIVLHRGVRKMKYYHKTVCIVYNNMV